MKTTLKNGVAGLNRIGAFSPYFFLPFVLILYFLVSTFDFHRFAYFNISVSVWPAVIVSLIAYYVGVWLADKRLWVFPNFGFGFLKGKTVWFIWILTMIGAIAYAGMLATGQIGLTDESVRRNLDPKLNLLSQLLWFGVVLLLALRIMKEDQLTKRKAVEYGAVYFGAMVLFLLMGYRTPIAVMMFTGVIIFHYIIRRINLSWLLGGMVVVALFFSIFGFIRFMSEDPDEAFNSREQPDVELSDQQENKLKTDQEIMEETPEWIRSLNGEMVNGHIVLSKIMEYTQEEGYLKGQLIAGTFGSILPGNQVFPRVKVTEVVNSLSVEGGRYITRPNRTTTPTYIGQLFLDGGYLLVAIGFFLFGAIISMLYNQMKRAGVRSYQTVAYAFVMTIFTVSLHTGLLDIIFFLMIGFVILTAAIELDRSQKKSLKTL
ncbi:oligosaccharide repeat unit polymerase [Bhargavaea ullalensis]|uniref:Oligosaccharide repeat unit polymerase n=1 Tax=Bhargavaea ullalensis TaxID=1265685 RepID=A0ABV2GAU5_9BACL